MFRSLALSFAAAFGLAGCSPQLLETPPVTIDTAKGPVRCQLYTQTLHSWDRSIDHPGDMTVAEADALCRAEGQRPR